MSAIKTLFKILLATVLLIALGIGALFAFVDPNDYRQEITDLVQEQTGRELEIGQMSLSLYPHIGINLEQTSLSNAQGFQNDKMLQADVISVGASILPLFQQRLEIDALTLAGLKLHLEKNADGKTNWDDLAGTDSETDTTTPDTEEKSNTENPLDKLAALSFGGLDIQDGQITWQDAASGQNIELGDLNITTGAVEFGNYFPINLSAKTSLNQPQLETTVELAIEAMVNKDGSYAVRNLALNNQTNSQELPVSQVIANLNIPTIDLAMQKQMIKLPKLSLQVQTTGAEAFPLSSINNQIELQDLEFNLAQMLLKIPQITLLTDASGPVLPTEIKQAKISTDVELNLEKETVSLKELQVNALNLQASGQVDGEKILTNPEISSHLNIAEFNLKQLLDSLGIALPPMTDQNRLQAVSAQINADFKGATETVSVDLKALKLDQSTLQGTASLSHFAEPKIRYSLNLDQIDLNGYLPPKTEQTEEAPQSDEELVIELPNELIRSLDIKGDIKVGDLKIDKLNPKNILVTLTAKNGVVDVSPLKADIFNTTINAKAGLDATKDTPKYSFETQAPKVPVGDVLLAFTDDDMLSGLGNVNLNLTTSGKTVKQFMANLNGRTDANLADGAVKGFNLAQSIREAKAKLKGESIPASDEPKQTDFSSLIAKLTIVNGLVTTETLDALAPYMRITGQGTIDLPKESLDYLVKTKIVATDQGQGGKELNDLKGLTIPVKLTGNWLDPKISLDLKSLLSQKAKQDLEKKKAEVKAKIDEKKDKIVDDAKKQAEDKLKDALKNFKF